MQTALMLSVIILRVAAPYRTDRQKESFKKKKKSSQLKKKQAQLQSGKERVESALRSLSEMLFWRHDTQLNDTQHNDNILTRCMGDSQDFCDCFAECRIFIVTVNVATMNVVMLSVAAQLFYWVNNGKGKSPEAFDTI
jgi:hypothetical protein